MQDRPAILAVHFLVVGVQRLWAGDGGQLYQRAPATLSGGNGQLRAAVLQREWAGELPFAYARCQVASVGCNWAWLRVKAQVARGGLGLGQ